MPIKEGYCFNPSSNRICRLDTAKTKKLIKSGIVVIPRDLQMPNERIPETPEPVQEPEPPKPEVQEKELKSEVKAEMKSIINENKNEFKELSQRETDALLKRMLFEKLCVKKKKKKKKAKPKPKKKKYKLRKIESSSESESESESDSD